MNIQEVLNFCQVYNSLAEKQMPIKLSYKLMKTYKSFADSCEFYQNQFNAIINEYGARKEDGSLITEGNTILLQIDKREEWTKKLNELNEIEVETPEPCIDIEEIEGLKISPKQLEAIDFLIK